VGSLHRFDHEHREQPRILGVEVADDAKVVLAVAFMIAPFGQSASVPVELTPAILPM
jgi:hypothetical protein